MKSKVITVIAASIALSAGFWLSSLQRDEIEASAEKGNQDAHEAALAEARKNYSPIQGSILSPARKISVPALIQDNGQSFSENDLAGHWSLLFFGYMNCPDICPVTMGVTAQAKKLAENRNKIFPHVYFISVDPQRDKIETLGEYVKYFDKDFIGVTGKEELIKALTLQMSVVYMKMQPTNVGNENYVVDHSSALLLLNPEGKLIAFMNPPHEAESILNDFETVVNETK